MRIVVGVDGSTESHRAVPWAAWLGATAGAHVDVLHSHGLDGVGGLRGIPADQMSATVAALETQSYEDCAAAFQAYDGRVEWAFAGRRGVLAEVLLDYVNETSVNIIVVASHDAGGVDRTALGHTVTNLVNRSTVPVLVVPPAEA
jgi:nucleotide-binding universal stress UspA family protein